MRIAILFFVLLSFCACSADRPFTVKCDPVRDFESTVQCTQKDTQYTFHLRCNTDGTMSAAVIQPDNLEGTVFYYNENGYTADANGLKNTFTDADLPPNAPIRLLFDGLYTFLFTGAETLTAIDDNTFSSQQTVNGIAMAATFTKEGQITRMQSSLHEIAFIFE